MKLQDSGLSALFDGELERHESRPVIDAALENRRLRDDWQVYALVGNHLRHDGHLAADITASVMARLQTEAVVLAPGRLGVTRQRHTLLALAASVAGVALVGWLALARVPEMEPRFVSTPVAATLAGSGSAPAAAPLAREGGRDLREYMLAHHAHAAAFRLGDSTEHVRTVVMATPARRP